MPPLRDPAAFDPGPASISMHIDLYEPGGSDASEVRNWLRDNGYSVNRLDSLAQSELDAARLLLLPGGYYYISDSDLMRIKRAMENGTSVYASCCGAWNMVRDNIVFDCKYEQILIEGFAQQVIVDSEHEAWGSEEIPDGKYACFHENGMLMAESNTLTPLVKFDGHSGYWSIAMGQVGRGMAVLATSHPEHSKNRDPSCDKVLKRLLDYMIDKSNKVVRTDASGPGNH